MCAICLAITCDGLEKLLNIVKYLASLKMYDTRKHFIYCGSYEDELRSIESTGYSFKTLNRQQNNNNNITRLVTELNYTLDPYISTWTTHFLPQKSSVTSSCLFKPEMLAYANIFLMSKPIREDYTSLHSYEKNYPKFWCFDSWPLTWLLRWSITTLHGPKPKLMGKTAHFSCLKNLTIASHTSKKSVIAFKSIFFRRLYGT